MVAPVRNIPQASAVDEVLRALRVILEPSAVAELRALGRVTFSGYFDDPQKLARAAVQLEERAKGVYVTLNPLNPALLARAANRVRIVSDRDPLTSDLDVLRRRWLPLDFDPIRPAGVSATDEEKRLALERATEARNWLRAHGWPEPVIADSGNGVHLLYRVDLPNDDTSRELVRKSLEALSLRFADGRVALDTSVFNAARIWRLYGTVARKGDSTPDRPHRRSRLLRVPERLDPVPRDLLEALAAMVPEQPKPELARHSSNGRPLDVERWLADHGLEVVRSGPWGAGGRKWVLAVCPWNPDHRDRSAYVVQFPNGAVAAGCHHNSCRGRTWHDLRDAVEPGWRERRASDARETEPHVHQRRRQESQAVTIRVVDATELLAGEIPEELASLPLLGVSGYILEGWSHLLAGYPKVGKSELVFTCARDWVRRGVRVLWLSEESELVWRLRLRRDPDLPQGLRLVFALGAPPDALLERAASGDEAVVVVDTIRSLLGISDEADNAEIARALGAWEARLREKTRIYLHHLRKDLGDHGLAVAGGTMLVGAVDRVLELRHDSHDEQRRLLRVISRISGAPDLLIGLDEIGWPVALGDPGSVELEQVANACLEVLEADEWLTKRQVHERLDEPKPSLKQVGRALELLLQRGLAERDPAEEKRGTTYRWRRAAGQPNLDRIKPPRSRSGSEPTAIPNLTWNGGGYIGPGQVSPRPCADSAQDDWEEVEVA